MMGDALSDPNVSQQIEVLAFVKKGYGEFEGERR
jgi:hypothetical protein